MVHSSFQKEQKLLLDMLEVGVPPRPETEVKEEISQESNNTDSELIEKLKSENIQLQESHKKYEEAKQSEIKALRGEIESLKQEIGNLNTQLVLVESSKLKTA